MEFSFASNADTNVGEGFYVDDVGIRADSIDLASVSIISGANTTVIANNGNLQNLPDNSQSWLPASFDLSNFAGQKIQIQFSFASDSYFTGEGWYVDDVVVSLGSRQLVTITPGQVYVGKDFGGLRVIDAGPDQTVVEGSQVNLTQS